MFCEFRRWLNVTETLSLSAKSAFHEVQIVSSLALQLGGAFRNWHYNRRVICVHGSVNSHKYKQKVWFCYCCLLSIF